MLLDESYSDDVRHNVPRIGLARLSATSMVRFTAPLLASIARDFHVSLATLGVAVSISELVGLTTPLFSRRAEHWSRRRTMQVGLATMATGALLISATRGPVTFAIFLIIIALGKNIFDLGTNSWVSDNVPYESRARVIGITEMSWSGGLLIGVPILLVAVALTNWRGGYFLAAVCVIVFLLVFIRPLGNEAPRTAHVTGVGTHGLSRSAISTVAAVLLLMAASQAGFVTFGSWLRDRFGFGDAALGAVSFALGLGEFGASLSTSRFTDRWGKQRSVQRGAGLMVPCGLLLATGLSAHLVSGVALLMLFFFGFEFAIVSSISLTSNLVPRLPAKGIGIGIGAATLGRALAAIPATRLYDAHGFGASMILAACCAAACVGVLSLPQRHE